MIVIPSYKGPIFASLPIVEAGEPPEPPAEKSTVYVFNIFWDNEVIANRYDTTSTTTETTARGWFIR